MSEEISVQQLDKILKLSINRPARKNALTLAMYSSLSEHIAVASEKGIRVIVLCGEGGNFTSGNDLGDFAEGADLTAVNNPIVKFLYTLLRCPIPVVVAVEGVAVGIGTTLLLHSDMVYADSSAQFQLPFVNLGLCPEFASSLMLPALVGHVKAAEWLLLGEFFSAAEARQAGIVNAIVGDPLEVAMEQAEKLAEQPPAALRGAKALMKAPQKTAIENVLQKEFEIFGQSLKGPEFAEAVAAFFEKRAPDFSSFK